MTTVCKIQYNASTQFNSIFKDSGNLMRKKVLYIYITDRRYPKGIEFKWSPCTEMKLKDNLCYFTNNGQHEMGSSSPLHKRQQHSSWNNSLTYFSEKGNRISSISKLE
uniref:Very-long-chain 3R-3-hydroxyacyl-acyl-carrier protein dehydratase 2 isoform X2 n=1 Tax=Rhizophora mucronata TaxID=61149 RepID=A0A2P2KLJ9_RHIMU